TVRTEESIREIQLGSVRCLEGDMNGGGEMDVSCRMDGMNGVIILMVCVENGWLLIRIGELLRRWNDITGIIINVCWVTEMDCKELDRVGDSKGKRIRISFTIDTKDSLLTSNSMTNAAPFDWKSYSGIMVIDLKLVVLIRSSSKLAHVTLSAERISFKCSSISVSPRTWCKFLSNSSYTICIHSSYNICVKDHEGLIFVALEHHNHLGVVVLQVSSEYFL
ncbi:hypothetical protein Tco_0636795, partial [Tanacetum coccineum]